MTRFVLSHSIALAEAFIFHTAAAHTCALVSHLVLDVCFIQIGPLNDAINWQRQHCQNHKQSQQFYVLPLKPNKARDKGIQKRQRVLIVNTNSVSTWLFLEFRIEPLYSHLGRLFGPFIFFLAVPAMYWYLIKWFERKNTKELLCSWSICPSIDIRLSTSFYRSITETIMFSQWVCDYGLQKDLQVMIKLYDLIWHENETHSADRWKSV